MVTFYKEDDLKIFQVLQDVVELKHRTDPGILC